MERKYGWEGGGLGRKKWGGGVEGEGGFWLDGRKREEVVKEEGRRMEEGNEGRQEGRERNMRR